jgi:hypothetical protein
MMTGAKIVLNTRMDAVRDGLAALAGTSWMMSLPQLQAAYSGHPAGRGRPGLSADSGAGLVAVTFGDMATPAADRLVLPVRWEPVEPGDEVTVELNGSIALAPAADRGHSALTLAGFCQEPPGAPAPDVRAQPGPELMEASRDLIVNVARDVTHAAGLGPEHDPLGPAWAW